MEGIILSLESPKEIKYISDIRPNCPGLIIVYNDNYAIGYINYHNDEWQFCETIDSYEYSESQTILEDLIDVVQSNYPHAVFTYINFETNGNINR